MQYVYQDLADAIVLKAVEDYRNALDGRSYSHHKSPEEVIIEVEKFFRSSWFGKLTKINSEYLIEQLKKEHQENERRNNESNTDSSNT